MADCDNNVTVASVAAARLQHFLYLGTEGNIWKPAEIAFLPDDMTVKTLIDEGKGADAVNEIMRFHKQGWYINQDTIAYALAIATQSVLLDVKKSAFDALAEICKSSRCLLAFVHFREKLAAPKTAWGRSVRRFLMNWYNERDAKDLATEVTRLTTYHRWTHKDVLCLAHVKPRKTDTAAVLKYIFKGLKAAETEFGEADEARDVLSYLKAIHELKHTTDHHKASMLIESHDLCFEHVPSHLLKSKEIWSCLIPRLKMEVLLQQLPRFHRLGLLKLNSCHLKALLERLRDESALASNSLSPLETFLPIRQWEASNRIVPGRPVVRQNIPQLDEALLNLYLASFKMVPSTGKRYLIAVDVRFTMVQSHVSGYSCMSPADVCAVTLMALAKAETSNVTTVAFSTTELVPFDVHNKMTLVDIAQQMRHIPMGPVNFTAPVQWALEKKKPFDVFVVLTDNQTSAPETQPVHVLEEYRKTLNLPNTRYISCALCSREFPLAPPDDLNLLDISGFHMKLLKVLQDFAQHVF